MKQFILSLSRHTHQVVMRGNYQTSPPPPPPPLPPPHNWLCTHCIIRAPYNRLFPSMEATNSHAIKNQLQAPKAPY